MNENENTLITVPMCVLEVVEEVNWNEENRHEGWLEIMDNWWHWWRALKKIKTYTYIENS